LEFSTDRLEYTVPDYVVANFVAPLVVLIHRSPFASHLPVIYS